MISPPAILPPSAITALSTPPAHLPQNSPAHPRRRSSYMAPLPHPKHNAVPRGPAPSPNHPDCVTRAPSHLLQTRCIARTPRQCTSVRNSATHDAACANPLCTNPPCTISTPATRTAPQDRSLMPPKPNPPDHIPRNGDMLPGADGRGSSAARVIARATEGVSAFCGLLLAGSSPLQSFQTCRMAYMQR